MNKLPVLFAVALCASVLADAGPVRGHYVTVQKFNEKGRSAPELAYLTTGAEVNVLAGEEIVPAQLACIAWYPPTYSTAKSGCGGSCNGTAPMAPGMCCWTCFYGGDCGTAVYTAACPGAGRETGGGQVCIGQRCTK